MVRLPEVWVVNNWEAIQWMQKPTPITQLGQFDPWKCKTQVHSKFFIRKYIQNSFKFIERQVDPEDRACNIGKSCKLQSRELRGDRYLHTCKDCPDVYPWIKNEFGLDI